MLLRVFTEKIEWGYFYSHFVGHPVGTDGEIVFVLFAHAVY